MSETFAHALRSAGLRVTSPRLAVLTTVTDHPHVDAETVATMVRDRLGTVSRQAIYDALHVLSDAHILRKVDAGRSARYEIMTGDNHHHLYCTECGALDNVACHTATAPCLEPADAKGYEISLAEVMYRGVCPDCQQKEHNDHL